MDFWIGVLAICLSKDQKCVAEVTPSLFPSESKCREYIAKQYANKKVTCVLAEQTDEIVAEKKPEPVADKIVTEIAPLKTEVGETITTEMLDEMTTH